MHNKLKKNYIYSLFYQVLTMLLPLVTAPYVARVLGADGIGIYSYTQSYMTYFTMFAALGTSSYGMREIARCRDKKEEYSKKFWEIEMLSISTTLICSFAWLIFIKFSYHYSNYFIALSPLLVATMFDISWFYMGHEEVGYTVFWNAICKIIGVILIFKFVNTKDDLSVYILINSMTVMLSNISMWVFLPKRIVKIPIKKISLRNHFKETLIYFIPTIATTIYTVLDKTFIGVITRDEYQNGCYEQATKIINMAKTAVFVSVNKVMEARISYLFIENNVEEVKRRIAKSLSFILLLGYCAMFGIVAVAPDFVPLFFGEGYDLSVVLLRYMSPLIVIIGISNCLGSHYYTPAGLRTQSSLYIIVGSIVNLICNIVFISRLGAVGAVVSSLLAELSISVLYQKNSKEFMPLKQIWVCSYKRIIAGFGMLLIVYQIHNVLLLRMSTLIIEVICAMLVYAVILIILKDAFIMEFIKEIIFLKRKKKE